MTTVRSGICAILAEISKRHPVITEIIVVSDHASSFASSTHIPFIVGVNRGDFGEVPKVLKWMFTEAQKGKTLLDAHFAFVTLQLRRAIFNNVHYLDPLGLYTALVYDGGLRGTSTLLVNMDETASKSIHDECMKTPAVETMKKGIMSVHEFFFDLEDSSVSLFKQSGLCAAMTHSTKKWVKFLSHTGKKTINIGETIDRFQAADIRSLKAKGKSNVERKKRKNPELPEKRIFPRAVKDAVEICLASTQAKAAASAAQYQNIVYGNDLGCATFVKRKEWAPKKKKNWISLGSDVTEVLKEMWHTAMSNPRDRTKRYNAERATLKLKETVLKRLWDQQYVTRVSKVKQWFSNYKPNVKKQAEAVSAIMPISEQVQNSPAHGGLPEVPFEPETPADDYESAAVDYINQLNTREIEVVDSVSAVVADIELGFQEQFAQMYIDSD